MRPGGQPTKTTSGGYPTRTILPLSETNLALHNTNPYIGDAEKRSLRLQKAGRQLDFDLPRKCFESEKWDGGWRYGVKDSGNMDSNNKEGEGNSKVQ